MNPNGSFGETRRGEYFGSSRWTVDLGLFKRFSLPNAMNLQFRAEFFNLFNTVNWNNPGTTVVRISLRPNAGAQDPRIMQFGLKFGFLNRSFSHVGSNASPACSSMVRMRH